MKNVIFQNGRRIAIRGTPTTPAKQAVSREELWNALTDAEREAMAISTNAKVQAFIVGMLMTGAIPCHCFDDRLKCLSDSGVLTTQRRAELVNALG